MLSSAYEIKAFQTTMMQSPLNLLKWHRCLVQPVEQRLHLHRERNSASIFTLKFIFRADIFSPGRLKSGNQPPQSRENKIQSSRKSRTNPFSY